MGSTLSLMTQQPRTPTQITDPTGRAVAANVRRIRDEVRGWSTYELSRKMSKIGRPIAPSALAKVERGERRVDVGDLMALALALRVNPNALLLPATADGEIEVTGGSVRPADEVWEWAEGGRPLDLPTSDDGTAHNIFQTDARPAGRRRFVGRAGAGQMTTEAQTLMETDRLRYEQETGEQIDPDTFRRLWIQARFGVKPEERTDG